MWQTARNKQEAVCLTTQPGCVAAVQLRQLPGETPQLLRASVLRTNGNIAQRLDRMIGALGIRNARLNLLLENGEYQFPQTEMPQVPAEEIRNALRWQIKDLLRHPLDDSSFDCISVPENRHGRRAQGFVAAAGNALLLERMQQFRYCKSSVDVIDVAELAQRNIAERLGKPEQAKLVLSISPAGCLLTASRDGALYFTRNFELASDSISDDAETRRSQFDRLLLELQRSIDVLEHQYDFMHAPALWLAPFAYVDELLSLLIENLYLPVHRIELGQLVDCSRSPLPDDAEEQAILFQVLGLALRNKGAVCAQVNLVNPALLPPKPFFQLHRMLSSLAAIAAIITLAIALAELPLRALEKNAAIAQQRINNQQTKLKTMEQHLSQRQKDPHLASEVARLNQEQQQLDDLARQLARQHETGARSYSAYLAGLSAAVTPGIWLTGIDLRDEHVSLYGMSSDARGLPVYLDKLNRQPVFKGLHFESFELGQQTVTASTPAALGFKLESTAGEKR